MSFLHKYLKSALKLGTAGILIAAVFMSASVCMAEQPIYKVTTPVLTADEAISYSDYLNTYAEGSLNTQEIVLNATSAHLSDGSALTVSENFEGSNMPVISLTDEQTAIWNFEVKVAGFYELCFYYYPLEGNGNNIRRDVLIDGSLPFAQSADINLSRVWANEKEEMQLDIYGNQILATQKEFPRWLTQYAFDASGLTEGALKYYLSEGNHTLSLVGISEPIALTQLKLTPEKSYPTYSQVKKEYERNGYEPADTKEDIVIEAEKATLKSEQSIYPVADKTSPAVSPSDPMKVVYNSIGGSQWANNGQWIEWEFDAPTDGLYNISMHYKQNSKTDQASVRKLLIDGVMPFVEAESLLFPYGNSWDNLTLSNDKGEPYEFYLTKGKHTIRLEVSLGFYRETMTKAKEYLTRLNKIYREIVVVTGTSPDVYRTYHFDKAIPETLKAMEEMSGLLKEFEKELSVLNGGENKNSADIKRLYSQIDYMLEDYETIANRLVSFKDNVSSFGAWINNKMGQPMHLDTITVHKSRSDYKESKSSIFEVVKYYTLQFISSFVTDYESVGNTGIKTDKQVKVWLQTGRDQAQILKLLANSDFTVQMGIGVDLQLVPANSLLPAILTENGPDVVLSLAQSEPINLALRKGLYDLKNYEDYENVAEWFDEQSIIPYKLENGVYALPQTLSFSMLFYRSDILKELNISLESLSTWDGLLGDVLPNLRKSSLSFGILPSINNYLTFAHQSGAALYNEDGSASTLDSAEAISAMDKFTMLYKQYGLDLSFDFANRFRTGEMPIAISDFTSYNQLSVFAPEIKGLWGMLPLPGTIREDGTIDYTGISTTTACAILSQSDDKESAWEFLKWWLSADAQDAFGKGMESLLGSAARYNPANSEAFARTAWDSTIKKQLIKQSQNLVAYREVPGGYFATRMFDFAFRDIVYDDKEIRTTMINTAESITSELIKKRNQYNLGTEE